MSVINITIPIVPTAQARPRFATRGGFVKTYKSKDQQSNEWTLESFLILNQPTAPMTGALFLGARAYLPIPVSKSKKFRASALLGEIRPISKPDLDNLLKNIKDSLTRMRYWVDDKNVVGYLPGTGKYYDDGKGARWEITIQGQDA
jgi:Holliday junction resolvase RusA-like endonuclease